MANFLKDLFLELLEEKKQQTLRKINTLFDNPDKEAELKRELDRLEAAELLVKNAQGDFLSTGLFQDNKGESQNTGSSAQTPDSKATQSNKEPEPLDEAEEAYQKGWRYEQAKEYEKALPYYQKAASLGNANAQVALGNIYYLGLGGVPEDNQRALFWYEKAAAQGNIYAYSNIGAYYTNDGYSLRGLDYYLKAAEGGLPSAMKIVGLAYAEESHKCLEGYRWLKKYRQTLYDEYEKNQIDKVLSKIRIKKSSFFKSFPDRDL